MEDLTKFSNFEGTIEIIEKKPFDTLEYTLTIRKNLIKLDKIEEKVQNQQSLLFNLEDNSITAIHHDKKMFINVPVQAYQPIKNENLKVIKTQNFKIISGFKCYQWRVKNINENTEITYWVAGNGFGFYNKFLKLWNKTDKCHQYFLTIPEASGNIPIQQIERTLLRDVKSTIIIHKIIPHKIDSMSLTVPASYHLFTS
jgi:hypothetical protein